jgi:hypothetical protein
MFSLTAENSRGERLVLTQNPAYVITGIDGLNPPDAVLNLYKQAGADGMKYNSATLDARQMILTMAVNGPAEENRIALYRYFQTKKTVRLYYSNDNFEVYIDGYVQNMTIDYFGQKQIVQITIICTDPFFHYAVPIETTFGDGDVALFEFPFSAPASGLEFSRNESGSDFTMENPSSECGMLIRFQASGSVSRPKIFHGDTDEFIGVNASMSSGDIIEINTRIGSKSITKISGATRTNLISSRMDGSSWIRMLPGLNHFSVSASSGSSYLKTTLIIEGEIEGV